MAFLPLVGMAATVAGGAISAYGQMQEGKVSKAMYDYRAAIAKQNAIYEGELGERQAGIEGMKERARAGQIRAAQGASGLDVNRGTAVNVQESQHALGMIDQENIRYNTARRAYGETEQAALDTSTGKMVQYSGDIGAAGTILGTGGKVADKWLQASSVGINMFGA